MPALINASTGYDTVADFTDTTPQPDSASSGAALVTSFTSIPRTSMSMSPGREIEIGTGSIESWGIVGG